MKLLVLAAVASPERAEKFAKLIPKEWMKERIHHHNEWFLGPFWPELVSKRPGRIVYNSASDMKSLVMDPAAALAGSEVSNATPRHVEYVLTISAPYVPEEAGEWVRRLPAGLARHHGEWLLLVAQARENPEALLRFVADHPGFKPLDTDLYDDVGLEGFLPLSNGSKIGVCLDCLRQMRVKGGDWKGWMEQMPEDVQMQSDLLGEAQFLDHLDRGGDGAGERDADDAPGDE